MAKKKPETATEMLEAIEEFAYDPGLDFKRVPLEEVESYLEESGGFDADRVLSQSLAEVDAAVGQLELQQAREARLREGLTGPAESEPRSDRESLIASIRKLASENALAAVYARGLEELTVADLQALLQDVRRLVEESNVE